MIKCELGIIEVKGPKEIVLAEFSTLCFYMLHFCDKNITGEELKEKLKEAIETKPGNVKECSDEETAFALAILSLLSKED